MMKIRGCFVSNSSSSSFIVVGNSLKKNTVSLRPWKHGDLEFDYGNWSDCDSKLNFLMIQRGYTDNPTMTYMLKDFCEKYNIDYDEYEKYIEHCMENNWSDNYPEAYIDHQSVAYENSEIYDIFNSLENIERFVFDDTSILIMRRD